jgi:hypothetical protein
MKIRDFELGSGLMQDFNHVRAKFLDDWFFFFLVTKILFFEVIESEIIVVDKGVTEFEGSKIWVNFFPKKIIFKFLFIIGVFITDAILIFHFVVLVLHQTGDKFGLVFQFLGDINGLIEKEALLLLVEFLFVRVVGPDEPDQRALFIAGDVDEVGLVDFVDEDLAAEFGNLLVIKVLHKSHHPIHNILSKTLFIILQQIQRKLILLLVRYIHRLAFNNVLGVNPRQSPCPLQ